MPNHNSKFDAGLFSYVWLLIWTGTVNLITLGLAYPWMTCAQYGWRIEHTIVSGKRLRFDGQGHQLFGMWIKWWLLSVVTLGIYAIWVPIKVEQWRVAHTYLEQ
ncbi:MAG: YjgN family protein [Coriobacteriia bacterium]|nr:YjgN family protein [Coriobacteriia bacterium]